MAKPTNLQGKRAPNPDLEARITAVVEQLRSGDRHNADADAERVWRELGGMRISSNFKNALLLSILNCRRTGGEGAYNALLMLIMALADSDEDGCDWMSAPNKAQLLGVSKPTILKYLKTLADDGAIRIEKRPGHTSKIFPTNLASLDSVSSLSLVMQLRPVKPAPKHRGKDRDLPAADHPDSGQSAFTPVDSGQPAFTPVSATEVNERLRVPVNARLPDITYQQPRPKEVRKVVPEPMVPESDRKEHATRDGSSFVFSRTENQRQYTDQYSERNPQLEMQH